MKHKPDTTTPCEQCNGTGRKATHECGACFGFGLSTAPYDQRRNGTTITVWNDEPKDTSHMTIHNSTYTEQKGLGGRLRKGYILLVSWANPNYQGA